MTIKTQHDKLFDKIDWENILRMPRYAGGHDEQMKGLIKGAKVIAHWNEKDYQGQVATILKVRGIGYVFYTDYYGSCSGCDAWEDAEDEDVKKMCKDLVYTSKIFKSLKKVVEHLKLREVSENVGEGLLKELDSLNVNKTPEGKK